MARTHGRVLSSILLDDDFRTLSESAQRLYLILLAQPDLNTAGVMSINYRRWARSCTSTTVGHIEKAALELDERRYVLLDEDTEEAFVRSLIRNDGIAKQPQMLKNALRVAAQVVSPRIRAELAAELRRLGRDDATACADAIDPADSPRPPSPQPPVSPKEPAQVSPIQADGSLPAGSPQPDASVAAPCADPGGEGEGEGGTSPSARTSVSKRPAKSRGTRIPENFDVTPEMRKWGRENFPHIDGPRQTELFVDHWRAASGPTAVKADWVAAWRNWIRKADEFGGGRPTGRHLAVAPAIPLPSDPDEAFADLRRRAAAPEAARFLGISCLIEPQPPSDKTDARQWEREQHLAWLDAHERQLVAAFTERSAG